MSCNTFSHPSLLSSAQAHSAKTSFFPSRSTPNAVKMRLVSHFSPWRILKWRPSRYTTRQWGCKERSRHASNCSVSVWLRRLMVLALGVLPLSMVDNSAFSPNYLTILLNLVYASLSTSYDLHFKQRGTLMMLQMFLLLLLSFFTFYLAQLCHLYCTRHWFPHSKAVALHPAIHRLLRPRSPRDCPACRLSSTLSPGVLS